MNRNITGVELGSERMDGIMHIVMCDVAPMSQKEAVKKEAISVVGVEGDVAATAQDDVTRRCCQDRNCGGGGEVTEVVLVEVVAAIAPNDAVEPEVVEVVTATTTSGIECQNLVL
jgi:hypothetical protein